LQAFHARPPLSSGRVAILLHGWEGSADAYYVVSLGHALFAAGVEVFRLNLRDHGGTQHLNEGIFHSCRLPEVCGAIRVIAQRSSTAPWLAGFSLGGNFLLRVAAIESPDAVPLAGVVAVSPVLHPDTAMRAMEDGWFVYERYFVRKWSRSLRRKRELWPGSRVDDALLKLRALRPMTAAMVARHTNYPTLQEYLDGYAVTGNRLNSLRTRAVILASVDDPIIPATELAELPRLPNLRVVTTRHGGHMGFMARPFAQSWVNRFVLGEMGLR
jgi:predicted alpha/beta-fold hydrolase